MLQRRKEFRPFDIDDIGLVADDLVKTDVGQVSFFPFQTIGIDVVEDESFPLIDLDEIEGRGIDCPFDAEGLSEAFAKSRFPCPEVAIGKDRLAAVERKGESFGYSPRLLDGGCHKLTLHL